MKVAQMEKCKRKICINRRWQYKLVKVVSGKRSAIHTALVAVMAKIFIGYKRHLIYTFAQ